MALTNDQIRALLQSYIDGYSDSYTDQRLIEFAQDVMKLNDPIDAVASQVVQELIPMSWVKCVNDLRIRTSCGLEEGKEAVERALVDYLREQLSVFEDKVKEQQQQTDTAVRDFSVDTIEYVSRHDHEPRGDGRWLFISEQGDYITRTGDYQDMLKTLPTGHYRLVM
jgi:hypothetical protein